MGFALSSMQWRSLDSIAIPTNISHCKNFLTIFTILGTASTTSSQWNVILLFLSDCDMLLYYTVPSVRTKCSFMILPCLHIHHLCYVFLCGYCALVAVFTILFITANKLHLCHLYLHCVTKKRPTFTTCYNFYIHSSIATIFGINVAEKVSNQNVLYFPTTPN